jgi:hypothetical protein
MVMTGAYLVAANACGSDGPERSGTGIIPGSSSNGGDGGDGGVGGAGAECDEGVIEECKVQIDENNCFVGEKQCQDGMWSECLDAGSFETSSFETKALSAPTDCASNPCNPYCQSYSEDPSPAVSTPGTVPPLGGSVYGLPAAFQNRGLNDLEHTGVPCNNDDDCQYDHTCNTTTGNCDPWPTGAYDASAGGVDLTVPVICDPSFIWVCNRGSVQAPSGVEIAVVANGSTNDFGSCDPAASGTLHDTCETTSAIDPGDCLKVTGCDINGTKTAFVNTPDPPGDTPPGAISEATCGNNWTVAHNNATCNCSATTASQSIQPVSMFMVLDNSISMATQSIWTPAKNAVLSFIQSPAADPIYLAFRVYGPPPTQPNCVWSNYASFPYAPQPLSNATHQTNLVNYLTPKTANAHTPHRDAVRGATSAAATYAAAHPSHKVVVVYISDGNTVGTCSGNDEYNVANQARANAVGQHAANVFASHGVLTYSVALPSASLQLLNTIASMGGTGSAINLTASSSASLGTDMTNALTDILDDVLSCDITIPNAGQIDPALVSVEYLPNGSTPATPLTKVANAAACTSATQYYLDDATNPTMITLCPSACTTIQGDANAVVNVTAACLGGYEPEVVSQVYEGDCSGFVGSGPVWELFSYDTTLTGDANVLFEMRTADTQGGLASATQKTISLADSTTPDVLASNPVDLRASNKLGSTGSQRSFLELTMTLTPTSDGTGPATVEGWNISYSCLNNE